MTTDDPYRGVTDPMEIAHINREQIRLKSEQLAALRANVDHNGVIHPAPVAETQVVVDPATGELGTTETDR